MLVFVIKSIPTVFAGVQYRSMLEARWAAFFRLMGINANYEPEAFSGYIPDFIYECGCNRPSCRCYWFHNRGFAHGNIEAACDVQCGPQIVFEVKGALEDFDLTKIRASGWCGPVVCLTSSGPESIDVANMSYHNDSGGGPVGTPGGFWQRLATRSPTGRQYLYEEDMLDAWREAGNLVQWRSPRRAA